MGPHTIPAGSRSVHHGLCPMVLARYGLLRSCYLLLCYPEWDETSERNRAKDNKARNSSMAANSPNASPKPNRSSSPKMRLPRPKPTKSAKTFKPIACPADKGSNQEARHAITEEC